MALNFDRGVNSSKMADILKKGAEESNKFVCADISLDLIDKNPENEELFSVTDIDHLKEVITSVGFTSPIEVFKKPDGRYEISAGHRRYAAMKELGRSTIPCFIREMPDDNTKKKILISSNIASRRLTPMEMANCIVFYKKILKDEHFKGDVREQTSKYFNISPSNVYRYECLLKLIPELQDMANKPQFPYSAFRAAASLSVEEQKILYTKLQAMLDGTPEDEEIEDKNEITLTRVKIEQLINSLEKTKISNERNDEIIKENNSVPVSNQKFSSSPIIEEDDNDDEIIINLDDDFSAEESKEENNKIVIIDTELDFLLKEILKLNKENCSIKNKTVLSEQIEKVKAFLSDLQK